MGYQDRRYDEGESGFRRAFRRAFSATGLFGWSLPLFTLPRSMPGLGGIHVRVHILYILIVLNEYITVLLRTESAGLRYVTVMMVTLFVLVLLHEFGHCLACRMVGGEADEILMWPLGGLAYCRPPSRWKAALVTTVGGPAVNVILVPLLAGALLLTGAGKSELLFNPLRPGAALGEVYSLGTALRFWLWSAYYMNLVLLLFNLVVPMYPMDGARIVQELLWGRLGYRRSMMIATTVGLVAAVALALFGLFNSEMRLVALALFGGLTCYNERQRALMTEESPEWMYDTEKGFGAFDDKPGKPSWAERRAAKAATKERAKAEQSQAAVDAILDKIRDQGLASLTARERSILDEASRKRRSQGETRPNQR
jgi:Zn-dependent protease